MQPHQPNPFNYTKLISQIWELCLCHICTLKDFWQNSLYLEHPLSRTSLYLELKSQSLCVSRNLFFSFYLELSLSRTNFLVPCEFEIERVNCSFRLCCILAVFGKFTKDSTKKRAPLAKNISARFWVKMGKKWSDLG